MRKKCLAWKSGLAGAIAREKMTIFFFGRNLLCNLRKNYAKKGFFALGVGAGRPLHSTSEPIPLPGRPAPTPRAKNLFLAKNCEKLRANVLAEFAVENKQNPPLNRRSPRKRYLGLCKSD